MNILLTRFAQKVLATAGALLTAASVPVLDGAVQADTWVTTVVTAALAVVTAVAGNLKEKREVR